MKYNYPIKYACMPIYEQTGWSFGINELEKKYEVTGYIASVCYVISEKKVYTENGNFKNEYEVVFPYSLDNSKLFDTWKREFPHYNCYHQCVNSIKVNSLFDTFDEAKEKCTELNEKLKSEASMFIPFDEEFYQNVENIHNEYDLKLSKYLNLETEIKIKTEDIMNNIGKPQNVIVVFKNENIERILPISLYDFINLYCSSNNSFLVCNVSVNDYFELTEQIQNNGVLDNKDIYITNSNKVNYLLVHKKGNDIVRIINYNEKDNNDSYYLENSKFLCKSKKMSPLNKDTIVNAAFDYDIVVYTIETFEDMIDSYKHDSIVLDNKCKKKIKNN